MSDYYTPGKERASKVRQLFQRIAGRYDLINDIQSLGLHRLWKRELVRQAALHASAETLRPPLALDLCCGTGDIALALARHGFQVHGVDFSEKMLDIARERTPSELAQRIRWSCQDVLALSEPNGTYDLITCAYGLRNIADIPAAVALMYRLLKPGGQLLILEFGKPENPILKALFRLYLKMVVPLFGLIFCRDADAYSYILDSLDHYPAQRGIDELLRRQGFIQTSWQNIIGGTMSLTTAFKKR